MVATLFRLVATRPELLAEHALGYVQLAAEEMADFSAHCRQRLRLTVCAICSATAALVLGGVSLLLWAMAPAPLASLPWLMWAVPAGPTVLALVCVVRLRTLVAVRPWRAVQAQWALDEAAWRA